MRTTAEPCACLANLPVSNEIRLPPARSTLTSCVIIIPSGQEERSWRASRDLQMAGNAPLEAANFPQHMLNGKLLAQLKLLNDGLVAFVIVCLEVIQQAASLADQHEKTAARTVIFLVRFEVLRQVTNALA